MPKQRCFVSVVIPTYNREEQLIKSLEAFKSNNDANIDFEVIVVNDGSKYDANKILQYRNWFNFVYFENEHLGPAYARNFGAKKATGKYIAFIDDDCAITSGWLKSIFSYFEKHKDVIAVGGAVKPMTDNKNWINVYLSETKHLDGPIRVNNKIVNMATANLVVERDAFFAIGGFDSSFVRIGAEDQDLVERLAKYGKIDFSDKIIVLHNHDISFKSFRKKYFTYGQGVKFHNLLRNERNSEEDIYMPYCDKKIDLILKMGKIYVRSRQYLIRWGINKKKMSLLKRLYMSVLSFSQEFFFQYGAATMKSLKKTVKIPKTICFRVTRSCNMKCPFCQAPFNKEHAFLLNDVLNTIKKLKEAGIKSIKFTGGEPYLRKDLNQIIQYCFESEIKPVICTNATMISDEDIKVLKKCHAVVKISIHGLKESHNLLTNSTNYDVTNANVKKLIVAGVAVSLHTLVMPENVDRLEEFLSEYVALGVKKISLIPPVERGRYKDKSDLSFEKIYELHQKLKQKFSTSLDLRLLNFTNDYYVIESNKSLVIERGTENDDTILVEDVLNPVISFKSCVE